MIKSFQGVAALGDAPVCLLELEMALDWRGQKGTRFHGRGAGRESPDRASGTPWGGMPCFFGPLHGAWFETIHHAWPRSQMQKMNDMSAALSAVTGCEYDLAVKLLLDCGQGRDQPIKKTVAMDVHQPISLNRTAAIRLFHPKG